MSGFFDWLLGNRQEPDDTAADSQQPGVTIVHLRSMRVPAARWDAEVYYDAWGSPYIKGYGSGPWRFNGDGPAVALKSDGKTDRTWSYGTEWRHKSGPPVRFPAKPTKPFSEPPSEVTWDTRRSNEPSRPVEETAKK